VELNGAKASFEFNPQTGQFETGPIVDAKDLRDNYTIEAKSTSTPRTISILKKEAVVNNPPPAPLRASFKTNAEYNAAYDKYDKDVWKPWAAKQIEANKAAVTKIETPDPETNGSEKIIKDQIKKIEAFIKQKGISVIDFSSTDCGPCQWMKPLLYQLAGQGLNHGSESVKFANFNQNSMGDGQDSKALETFMKKYGINSFPSLLVFKDGKLIVRSSGREDNTDKLKAKLTAALVAHDENPDAVIDTYTTELLGKIKSKSFEKNPVGTYGNLQARTVIAITSIERSEP
jgi:thiol-disulfide isomerase/thioredoxin